jgi:hypothetical protein
MKTMDKIHNGILRKFHALCGRLGLTGDEKHVIVSSYGAESSADLDTHDLINICAALEKRLGDGKDDEMDRLRKRAMASIGGYLRVVNYESNAAIIKAIACRVTGHDSFNKIPAERLRNLYNTFLNKQKDINAAEQVAQFFLQKQLTGQRPSALLN